MGFVDDAPPPVGGPPRLNGYSRAMLDRDFRCRGCDYQLKGIPSGACPECGRPFDWNKRTTYRAADEAGPVGAFVHDRGKRIAVFVSLLLVGQLVVLGLWYGHIPWAGMTCCCTVFVYPAWLVGCVIALLACVSPTGWLGTLGCLLIGCGAAVLMASTAGILGLYIAIPAGLVGGLIFKHMELNNFI